MPAFLYSRQGISSPANAEGIPEHFLCAYKRGWLPGIRQKGAAGLSADTPARQACGAAMFSTILHGCRAAPPFGLSPKRGQKRFFPSIRRPRRMNRPLPTVSDRLPPKAACCKPVHARSPAVSGRLFWRPSPSGGALPASASPPAAHPTPPNRLSKSPFLLMQPAYANQLFSADTSGGRIPASAACFGGRCHTAETPSGAGRPLCTHGVL